eukprot:2072735-Rhodomonas_salina.1
MESPYNLYRERGCVYLIVQRVEEEHVTAVAPREKAIVVGAVDGVDAEGENDGEELRVGSAPPGSVGW